MRSMMYSLKRPKKQQQLKQQTSNNYSSQLQQKKQVQSHHKQIYLISDISVYIYENYPFFTFFHTTKPTRTKYTDKMSHK